MRTLSLSSPLPLCDGVVVLDERPPVKSDGLGLSCRLLVNGCGGRTERRVIQRMSLRRPITPRGNFSNRIEAAGGWRRGAGVAEDGAFVVFFFLFLFN